MLLTMQQLRGTSKNILYIIGVVVVFVVAGGVVASTFMHQGKPSERVANAERVGKVEEPEAIDPPKEIKASPDAYASSAQWRLEAEERPAPVRQLLSRDELFAANWGVSWGDFVSTEWRRFGENEMKVERGGIDTILVRRAEEPNGIVARYTTELFVPSIQDDSPPYTFDKQEAIASTDLIVNERTGKLYAFITFGNSHLGWIGKVYESNIYGNNPKLLGKETSWSTGGVQDFRFSPDRTTLSYVAEETRAKLNENTGVVEQVGNDRIVFHIIDLLDTEKSVQFILPHSEKLLGYGIGRYWVRTWQFPDNESVEFTLYRRESTEEQKEVKELWRYDRETGESTLLKTVPFEQ